MRGSDLQSQIYDSYQKYGWETSAWNAMLVNFQEIIVRQWAMERILYGLQQLGWKYA